MSKPGRLDAFYTLTQASRRVQRTTETLRKYADAGTIRCIRDSLGRRLLLRKDVEALAERLADSTK